MSQSIATLLERNIHGIFGENDESRRREVAEQVLHEDAVFVEPHGIYRGRDEIVRIAGEIRATHPTFRYQAIAAAEDLHGVAGRLEWIAGAPGEPASYAGMDLIVASGGKISALYMFFDKLPEPAVPIIER